MPRNLPGAALRKWTQIEYRHLSIYLLYLSIYPFISIHLCMGGKDFVLLDVQRAFVVDQGLAGTGGVEELGSGVPL